MQDLEANELASAARNRNSSSKRSKGKYVMLMVAILAVVIGFYCLINVVRRLQKRNAAQNGQIGAAQNAQGAQNTENTEPVGPINDDRNVPEVPEGNGATGNEILSILDLKAIYEQTDKDEHGNQRSIEINDRVYYADKEWRVKEVPEEGSESGYALVPVNKENLERDAYLEGGDYKTAVTELDSPEGMNGLPRSDILLMRRPAEDSRDTNIDDKSKWYSYKEFFHYYMVESHVVDTLKPTLEPVVDSTKKAAFEAELDSLKVRSQEIEVQIEKIEELYKSAHEINENLTYKREEQMKKVEKFWTEDAVERMQQLSDKKAAAARAAAAAEEDSPATEPTVPAVPAVTE